MGDFNLKKLPNYINNYVYDTETASKLKQHKIGHLN